MLLCYSFLLNAGQYRIRVDCLGVPAHFSTSSTVVVCDADVKVKDQLESGKRKRQGVHGLTGISLPLKRLKLQLAEGVIQTP